MKVFILVVLGLVSQSAMAQGFGVDLLFDNLIATPQLIAHSNCDAFGVSQGKTYTVTAQEDSFSIQADDSITLFSLLVPQEGQYVFQGQAPDRIANQIVSNDGDLQAVMDPQTTSITISKSYSSEVQSCVLDRCPAFGLCE